MSPVGCIASSSLCLMVTVLLCCTHTTSRNHAGMSTLTIVVPDALSKASVWWFRTCSVEGGLQN